MWSYCTVVYLVPGIIYQSRYSYSYTCNIRTCNIRMCTYTYSCTAVGRYILFIDTWYIINTRYAVGLRVGRASRLLVLLHSEQGLLALPLIGQPPIVYLLLAESRFHVHTFLSLLALGFCLNRKPLFWQN